MAVSPIPFPSCRRRSLPISFLSPNLSPTGLLRSLHSLSAATSTLRPPLRHLLRRQSSSLLRKFCLLSLILDEILRNSQPPLSLSSVLCFEEMFILLHRVNALFEDCSTCSKMWLLIQIDSISSSFRELTLDLLTLLEIIPFNELNLSEDVVELRNLAIKQCENEKFSVVDEFDDSLRIEVMSVLDSIKKEIVPDQLKMLMIFEKLGLSDSASCRGEIECLEEEIQCQIDEKSKSEVIALIGLVRYAKCVLFGASAAGFDDIRIRRTVSDLSIPADFRCPITLDLMTDPVVVATGQTYDRTSITMWVESGHNTCPKTGQGLAHTNFIPNKVLRSLIATWCREHKVVYMSAAEGEGRNGVVLSKTALEVMRMTVSFLLSKLVVVSQSMEVIDRIVYELRVLAKTDSDSRACIGEMGALSTLSRYLGSEHPSLQVNAVTTILNISILEENKTRIMETDGVLNGVLKVLRLGATWEAKGNAAATIFSLAGVHANRKKLGKKTRVVKGLLELARDGPSGSKRDALVAILTLVGDRETAGKLFEYGVVDMIKDVMNELPEETMTILEVIVKKGGFVAVAATSHMIGRLVAVLRSGSDRTKESVIATLVIMCRRGGAEMVSELAEVSTIEILLWELMGTGTARAKRKAASLMRFLRGWAAGLDGDVLEEFSMTLALQ